MVVFLNVNQMCFLSTGTTREEGSAPNCARVSSFCPQEEDSQGTQGGGSNDILLTLNLMVLCSISPSTHLNFSFQPKQPAPFKAPQVPHFGLPFQPQLPDNHHVEICPFSFEERERERRAMKEKRLEEIRNEEVGVTSRMCFLKFQYKRTL